MVSIYDLDLPDLQELIASYKEPPYRATQIWGGLYRHQWHRLDQFSQISKSLQRNLADYFKIPEINAELSSITPIRILQSKDKGTVKTLFRLPDGYSIEAVLMRYEKRRTLCISTQAGCGMGCVFCATGQMGLKRHLSSGEIVSQVLYYSRQLADLGEKVTNIVIMGMGEPFHNYDATLAAVDRLNHPEGFNFGARRFTISTVGLIPAIRRFTRESRQVNLAISLHAVDNDLRSSLLPINQKYPLNELITACLEYTRATNRRLSFEWALIHDINDTPEHARRLTEWLQPFTQGGATLCHVNIILLNPTQKYSGVATTRQRAMEFASVLTGADIPCTIRLRRGIDIQAGCGQLATQYSGD